MQAKGVSFRYLEKSPAIFLNSGNTVYCSQFTGQVYRETNSGIYGKAPNTKIEFAQTTNRSVLGSMNDLIQQYIYMKSRSMVSNESEDKRLPYGKYGLNQIPMSMLKGKYVIEKFKEIVGL